MEFRRHSLQGIYILAALLVALLVTTITLAPVAASQTPSPAAGTPVASPMANPTGGVNGCDQLGTYFTQVAAFVIPNEGLAILKTVNNDVQALTDEKAATVVTSLHTLVTDLLTISPPPAAADYHVGYVNLIEWYRDMAETRDLLSHQRLINGDKRIIPAIGRGIYLGQSTCGANVWNDAYVAAFPPAS